MFRAAQHRITEKKKDEVVIKVSGTTVSLNVHHITAVILSSSSGKSSGNNPYLGSGTYIMIN